MDLLKYVCAARRSTEDAKKVLNKWASTDMNSTKATLYQDNIRDFCKLQNTLYH